MGSYKSTLVKTIIWRFITSITMLEWLVISGNWKFGLAGWRFRHNTKNIWIFGFERFWIKYEKHSINNRTKEQVVLH